MRSASSAARSCSLGALLLLGLLVLPVVTLGFDLPPSPGAAPSVATTTPADRSSGAAPLAPIEVRFSEAMNASTVVYTIQPPVGTTANWPTPDRLVIQPDAPGLAPCTVYAVQVAGRDADEDLPLAPGPVPNPWSFMTQCASPFIVSTSPANGARNVRADADVVVTFNEPMDVLTVTIRLMPSPPGMITSWNGPRTVVTGRTTLESGTTYTVTVEGRDDDGNALVAGFAPNPWSFSVNAPPTVTGPSLSSGGCLGAGTPLGIGWTMADDRDAAPDLTVHLSFLNGTREDTILGPARGFPSPASTTWTLPPVDVTTRVRLRVNDSASGVATVDSPTFRIDTSAPRVASTNPANGATDVPLDATVNLVFSEEMDRASVAAALSSDPPLAGALLVWSPDGTSLTIHPGGLRDRTTYRVTVGPNALDTCGPGRPSGATFTFLFTTAKAASTPPPLLWSTDVTETSISLAWERVTTFVTGAPIPPGASVTYRVFRSTNVTDVGQIVLETNGTVATDRNLRPGTPYVFRVRAVVDGVASEPTAPLEVRTRDPFFTTSEGRTSLLVAFVAAASGLSVGILQWDRRRRLAAEARLEAEIQGIVEQVRSVRAETDPEIRREKQAALQERFRDLVEGPEDAPQGRPDSRLEGLYRALSAALVQTPEVDVARGRAAVDARLGPLAPKVKGTGAAYRLLSEAEASVRSDLFPGLPESGRKALLLVYFYALEEYLGARLRALVPAGATVLLGDRGHINVRRRGWERHWANLSLGTFVYLAALNRHFFVADDARWEAEVEPLLREAVEARNKTAHPSEVPPELDRVRRLVYGSLGGLEAVLRTTPTSGVGA